MTHERAPYMIRCVVEHDGRKFYVVEGPGVYTSCAGADKDLAEDIARQLGRAYRQGRASHAADMRALLGVLP